MENVIAERAKKISLTKTQKKIADYFVHNLERTGMSSSLEIAREIGVSDASITRFARAIGYDGFTDLKNDIYNNLAMNAANSVNGFSLAERYDRNQTTFGPNGTKLDYLKILQHNTEQTFLQNSDEVFDKAVTMLLQAKHRYIMGFRSCLGVAYQCAYLLRFLVDHVISVLDEGPGGIGLIQDIEEQDCLLLFSVSRYYKIDIRLAELAKKRGAVICVVTDSLLSPLTNLADILLLAETKHVGFIQSAVGLTTISEYLITRVTQKSSESYYRIVKERDELSNELRMK